MKILKCPKCEKRKNLKVKISCSIVRGTTDAYVRCKSCHTKGPVVTHVGECVDLNDLESYAIDQWNTMVVECTQVKEMLANAYTKQDAKHTR